MSSSPETPESAFVLRSVDRDWPLDKGELTVGRTAENDIVLEDSSVSRRHAVLYVTDGGVRIEDLGSSNGTYVNGVQVAEATTLDPGDRVLIGSFQLGFAAKGPAGERRRKQTRPMPNRDRKKPSGRRPAVTPVGGVTAEHSVHGMLVAAADRALTEGDVESAGSAVTNLLVSVRANIVRGAELPQDVLDALERQILKLLDLTGQTHWLDQLLRTLEQVGAGISPQTANRIQDLAEHVDLSTEQLQKLNELMRG